jgi:hypothetical protein
MGCFPSKIDHTVSKTKPNHDYDYVAGKPCNAILGSLSLTILEGVGITTGNYHIRGFNVAKDSSSSLFSWHSE